MANFSSKWHRSGKSDGIGSKIRDGFRPPEPLKPRLEQASRQLQVQIVKLEQANSKLQERDHAIFAKIVASVQKGDTSRANMLANELSEIRKMGKIITQARLAIEQLTLRLSTVTELGDIAQTLNPALSALKGVRPGLMNLLPEAENEIGEISSVLSGLMVETGQMAPEPLTFETTSGEAERVLAEASAVVAQRIGSQFPDVPESTESNEAELA